MPGGSGNLHSPTEQFPASAPPTANSSFDTPRRPTQTQGRPPEELHISTALGQQHAAVSSSAAAQQQQHMYSSPDHYRSAPNINIDQGTPQSSQYGTPAVPGSLQPAGGAAQQQQQQQQQQRPGPAGQAYTAPVVPTQAQIASNAQQYTLPTRSNTQSQHSPHSAHSYSRSSPAGMGPDQKYIPFSNTPEQKYAGTTPAQKFYPTTPSGAASHSPLGLADIRPRANSTMDQEGMGYGNAMMNDQNKVPSNSNYLAPWSIYAYDWCKWNVPGGNSAGKMAVGSYLEDNHNFVRNPVPFCMSLLTCASDSHFGYADHSSRQFHPRRDTLWPGILRHRRGYLFISRHTDTMGAAIVTEAVYRSPCHIRGPSATVVTSASLRQHHEQHHHTLVIRKHTRTTIA